MKDQRWDLNQTWPIDWKWCLFTNAPQKFGALPQENLGSKNVKFWTTFSANSTHDTACLRNKVSHGQIKMLVSIYNVYPTGDLLSVTSDPETAEIRLLIVTQHLAAITLQPSKLRHLVSFYLSTTTNKDLHAFSFLASVFPSIQAKWQSRTYFFNH